MRLVKGKRFLVDETKFDGAPMLGSKFSALRSLNR